MLKDILNYGTYYALILKLNGRKYTYRLDQSIWDDKNKHYYIYDKTENKNFGSLYELAPKFYLYNADIIRRIEQGNIIIIKMTKDGSFQKLMNVTDYPLKSPNFNYTVNNSSYIKNE